MQSHKIRLFFNELLTADSYFNFHLSHIEGFIENLPIVATKR